MVPSHSTRPAHLGVALALAAVTAVLAPAAPAQRTSTVAGAPKGDLVAGKQLFRSRCGTCHTLQPAGTHGHIGPNLTWEQLRAATVSWMVTNGSSMMPGFKGVLKPTQIRDVAAFVAVASAS